MNTAIVPDIFIIIFKTLKCRLIRKKHDFLVFQIIFIF